MRTEEKPKLLLVEDEESLGYLLKEYLGMKGFEINWVKNGKEALKVLDRIDFKLAILDVMMPEMDGFTLAHTIKEKYPELPFLFLTAKSMKVDVLKGFSLGALDYLKKPIDEEELFVRIKAILNHLVRVPPKTDASFYKIGNYDFDTYNQKLVLDQQEQKLTKRESDLLKLLISNKNNLCKHRDILVDLWGGNDYFNRKSLNVFITRLRRYLKEDSNIVIENIHGQGFILRVKE